MTMFLTTDVQASCRETMWRGSIILSVILLVFYVATAEESAPAVPAEPPPLDKSKGESLSLGDDTSLDIRTYTSIHLH